MSASVMSTQLIGSTGTPYRSARSAARRRASSVFGYTQFRSTIYGRFVALSSLITRSSASSYSSRGMSLMLPSVVMTRPIVECSVMTFCVPISAAMLNGIGSSYHGVRTMRGWSSSMYPSALGTM